MASKPAPRKHHSWTGRRPTEPLASAERGPAWTDCRAPGRCDLSLLIPRAQTRWTDGAMAALRRTDRWLRTCHARGLETDFACRRGAGRRQAKFRPGWRRNDGSRRRRERAGTGAGDSLAGSTRPGRAGRTARPSSDASSVDSAGSQGASSTETAAASCLTGASCLSAASCPFADVSSWRCGGAANKAVEGAAEVLGEREQFLAGVTG